MVKRTSKQIMRIAALFFCAANLVVGTGHAQKSLNIRLSQPAYKPGDTLLFEATATNHKARLSTLHLVLEDVNHERYWRLRYPLLSGVATAAIVLPPDMPQGMYAFNFQLQGPGIHLMGRVLDKKPPEAINYIATASNKDVDAKTVQVDALGYFQVPNLLFDEKATFVFSHTYKVFGNSLEIALEAPADSAFVSLADTTFFVAIGDTATRFKREEYAFNAMAPGEAGTLQNVTVVGKKKKEVEVFEEKYVRGYFENQGIIFDGLEDMNFNAYGTLAEIINGKVPGLEVTIDRFSNESVLSIRGFEPAYFVDEIQTDYEGVLSVPTPDIAMIKVFRPPFMGTPMGSAGGAIAVYTKRGGVNSKYGPRYRFVVNGYTPQEFVLF